MGVGGMVQLFPFSFPCSWPGPQGVNLGAAHSLSLHIQVALPANSTEEVASIKLFITGRRIDIHEEKTVLIRRVNSGTFIQTDKPIYKPGQTGESSS